MTTTAKRKPLRVRVAVTVSIDVDAYRATYGIDDAATIRDDVKWAVLSAISSGGVLADGIVDVAFANKGR